MTYTLTAEFRTSEEAQAIADFLLSVWSDVLVAGPAVAESGAAQAAAQLSDAEVDARAAALLGDTERTE